MYVDGKVPTAVLCIAVAGGVFAYCGAAVAEPALTLPSRQAESGSTRARGKIVYVQGVSPSGTELSARVSGEVVVPAEFYPCRQCHGEQGRGGLEAGIRIPDITWSTLTAPDGAVTASGSLRPGYTGSTLARAIREGLDSRGQPLDIIMPRYTIADADLADLLAYLQVLGADDAPGTTPTMVRIGTLLPLGGARAEQGSAIEEILRKYFEQSGGESAINGRRIDYVVRDAGDTAESALAAAEQLIAEEGPMFCMVANAGAGADPRVLAFFTGRGVPVIGPLTFAADTDPLIFHVLPDLGDQARAAARVLVREIANGIAVVRATDGDAAYMADAFIDECIHRGSACVSVDLSSESMDALVVRLHNQAVEGVALFGSPSVVASFSDAARRQDWAPHLVVSAVLSGGSHPSYAGGFSLIAPPMALRRSHPEGERFVQLAPDRAGPGSALRMAAFAAAEISVDALKTSGRALTQRKLIAALSSIDRFETGVTPPLRYGPGRRRGLRGAVIVTPAAIDTKEAIEWVDVSESFDGSSDDRRPR